MRRHESRRRRRWWLFLVVTLVVAAVCITSATAAQQAAAPGYKPAGGWGKTGTANGQFAANGGGIAVDKAGNVYVADSDNARVQVFSAKGKFLRKWGSPGTGDGQFGNPGDLAVAPDGTIWVADDPNSRYEQFSSTGAFQMTLAAPTGELARDVAVASDGSVLGAVEGYGEGRFPRLRQDGKRVGSCRSAPRGQRVVAGGRHRGLAGRQHLSQPVCEQQWRPHRPCSALLSGRKAHELDHAGERRPEPAGSASTSTATSSRPTA